ncbi:MAG TPA: ATP-binding protein [Usitatibacter sp.]|nr:ATP-binding protein [Usitatibacter sp.]
MLRLFLRLYVFLMLPATAAFVFSMYVTDQVMAHMNMEQNRARAGQAFDRAERIITDSRVPDWQGRLKEIEKTFRLEHEIVPLSKAEDDSFMSASEKERLLAGDIAFRDRPGGGWVYERRIKDSDRVLRIEWIGAYEYQLVYYAIIIAFMTLAMSLILWRWMWPLWRDLQGLSAATSRVGEGDFDVRAQLDPRSLLQPIASAFNVMAGRVQALLRSHRDLEQGVAHELRTPLAQLKFDLELARTSDDAGERDARFDAMSRDLVDLEDLVSELLVLASLRQAPPYAPREVPAASVVDEAQRRVREEMRGEHAEVRIETAPGMPASLSCDPKYLTRALVNILRNAVRYARTRVVVSLTRDGGQTVLAVDDDGPGVPPADRTRLFEPFTRVEGSRGRDSGGVGLGLAIVKSVAEWHGGRAEITDSPLGGARVSIRW